MTARPWSRAIAMASSRVRTRAAFSWLHVGTAHSSGNRNNAAHGHNHRNLIDHLSRMYGHSPRLRGVRGQNRGPDLRERELRNVKDVGRVGGQTAVRRQFTDEARRGESQIQPHPSRQDGGTGKAARAALRGAAALEGTTAIGARVGHDRHRRQERQDGEKDRDEESGASCHGWIVHHGTRSPRLVGWDRPTDFFKAPFQGARGDSESGW
jgi:hypothetical protein